MKYSKVSKIWAVGTGKKNNGREFTAKHDANKRYVLNKKIPTADKSSQTNYAENKVYVETLTEAANLLATNEYVINLTCEEGTRALRSYNKVIIE
ncbi:hypothetical protein, partial [Photobacterium sanctipauli]